MRNSPGIPILCWFWILLTLSVCWKSTLGRSEEDACEIYGDSYQCPSNQPQRMRSRLSSLLENRKTLDCEKDLYQTVMTLLDDGKEILEEEFQQTQSDEAVMLIGNTGTGKSTLTYFLAGDNSLMFSYSPETDTFLIKDCNGKIGDGSNTVVSATIFPDLVVENSTGTSFFDNPGFQDTRTACIEIANTYFMQQIVNHVKKIKFVLVANKFDVSSNGCRDCFPKLLKSVMAFVPRIEKFGAGLALIATKLTALNSDDTPYIKDIVKFINGSKTGLGEIIQDPEQLRLAIFIADTLSDNSRIGVFRSPLECGPLDEIDLMQKNRQNILDLILNKLDYVPSEPTDFGLTISSEAQVKVLEISHELSIEIRSTIQVFGTALFNYLLLQFTCVNQTNCDDLISDLSVIYGNQDVLDEFANDAVWTSLNYSQVVSRITNKTFIPPKAVQHISDQLLEQLQVKSEHLDFLSNLAVFHIDVIPWLQPMKDNLGYLRDHLRGLIASIDQTFVRLIKGLCDDFQQKFENDLEQLVEGKLGDSKIFEDTISALYKAEYILSQNVEDLDPSVYMIEIVDNIESFRDGFSSSTMLNNQLSAFQKLSTNLDFLKAIVKDKSVSINPKLWISSLILLKTNVFDRVSHEISSLNGKMKSLLEQLIPLVVDHFNRLSTVESYLFQTLDAARRQFDHLKTFDDTLANTSNQTRAIFVKNLQDAYNRVNSIFIILGSQEIVNDLGDLDSVLTTLEHLNTGNAAAAVSGDWVLICKGGTVSMLSKIFNYANTHVNSFVKKGATVTGSKLTSRFKSFYNVSMTLAKQKELMNDLGKMTEFLTSISSCVTLRCFSSKNFQVLTQLKAGVGSSDLQPLPGQNLKVDLDDLGLPSSPYNVGEWVQKYSEGLLWLRDFYETVKKDKAVMQSPQYGELGSWGEMKECPPGTFVSGVEGKVVDVKSLGKTAPSPSIPSSSSWLSWPPGAEACSPPPPDTHVNHYGAEGIRFSCSPLDQPNSNIKGTVTSSEGPKGTWVNRVNCPGTSKAIGFQARIRYHSSRRNWTWTSFADWFSSRNSGSSKPEQSKTSWPSWLSWPPTAEACESEGGDTYHHIKMGIYNFALICEGGQVVVWNPQLEIGDWSEQIKCPKAGQLISGVQTRVIASSSNSGLVRVNSQCSHILP